MLGLLQVERLLQKFSNGIIMVSCAADALPNLEGIKRDV